MSQNHKIIAISKFVILQRTYGEQQSFVIQAVSRTFTVNFKDFKINYNSFVLKLRVTKLGINVKCYLIF
jgi:hypothetical protein